MLMSRDPLFLSPPPHHRIRLARAQSPIAYRLYQGKRANSLPGQSTRKMVNPEGGGVALTGNDKCSVAYLNPLLGLRGRQKGLY